MKKVLCLVLVVALSICLFFGCENKEKVAEENASMLYEEYIEPVLSRIKNDYVTTDDMFEVWGWGSPDFSETFLGESLCTVGNVDFKFDVFCMSEGYGDNEINYVEEILFQVDADYEFFEEEQLLGDAIVQKVKEEYSDTIYSIPINDYYTLYVDATSTYELVKVELNSDKSISLEAKIEGLSEEDVVKNREEAKIKSEEYLAELEKNAREEYEREQSIEDNRSWLITAAQKEVKKQLSNPSSADFPFFSDGYDIVDMGDGVYAVTVEVEHENTFGGTVDSTFVVRLKGSGISNYTLVGIARM